MIHDDIQLNMTHVMHVLNTRENSEIKKKQTKQSMESAKILAASKTLTKEERDRWVFIHDFS